jgi:hypothetical protein
MATVTTSTQIDTINILAEASEAQPTDLFLLQRGIATFKLPMSSLIIPVNQIAPIDNLRIIGNVSGDIAIPEAVVIDTDLTISVSDDQSIPTSKAVKEYVDETSTSEVLHYINMESSIITEDNVSVLTSAQINLASEALAAVAKLDDKVIVSFRYRYSYYRGNATIYRNVSAYTIFRVDVAWTLGVTATWVAESTLWQ